jgi:phage tail-like protein
MPKGNDAIKSDPLIGIHFAIEIQGGVTGYFTEVSGIGSESEVVEHKIMGDKAKESITRKIPGRLKWGDITLKRGITANMDMWAWRKDIEEGKVSNARKNGSVIMYTQDLQESARWNFTAGWPSKITGPAPKADGNEVGIEELVIVHEGIVRVN